MQEKIIKTEKCKHCNTNFDITDKDMEFYLKISPVFNEKKYEIPNPTMCYECRHIRRISFRNELNLYKGKCHITGKNIISVYKEKLPYRVVDQNVWWSDKFDGSDYFLEYDFDNNFFDQFDTLGKIVPRINLYGQGNENCDYTFDNHFSKNNYLTIACDNTENLLYSGYTFDAKDSVDSFWVLSNCHNVYDSLYITNSSNIKYSMRCFNSQNLIYCYDCKNCENCIGCKNLNGKKYYINNKSYTREEYENEKIKYENMNKEQLKNNFSDFFISMPSKNLIKVNCEESSGDDLVSCKNCINCFGGEESKDCKNLVYFALINDVYDGNDIGYGSSLIYEGQTIIKNNNKVLFCNYMLEGNYNCMYSMELKGCKNCFGCIGLKNKEYHILNKSYSREEYENLVQKIIKYMMEMRQWGEFFPSSISPFGYNETLAQEVFPRTKDEALKKGFNRSDYKIPVPKVEKIIPATKLPNKIGDIPDDILNWAVECEITNKPFRIISQELEFYRKHNLPIPKRHPEQRHLDRMNLRNPRKLFDRRCDKCNIEMKTTYSPKRKDVVYCEKCYNKEIY